MSQIPYQKPRLLRLSVKDHTNAKNAVIKESDGPGSERRKLPASAEIPNQLIGGGAVAPSG